MLRCGQDANVYSIIFVDVLSQSMSKEYIGQGMLYMIMVIIEY